MRDAWNTEIYEERVLGTSTSWQCVHPSSASVHSPTLRPLNIVLQKSLHKCHYMGVVH